MPRVTCAACRRIAARRTVPSAGRVATAGRSSTVLLTGAAGTVMWGVSWWLIAISCGAGDRASSWPRTYGATPPRETGKPLDLGAAYPTFGAPAPSGSNRGTLRAGSGSSASSSNARIADVAVHVRGECADAASRGDHPPRTTRAAACRVHAASGQPARIAHKAYVHEGHRRARGRARQDQRVCRG